MLQKSPDECQGERGYGFGLVFINNRSASNANLSTSPFLSAIGTKRSHRSKDALNSGTLFLHFVSGRSIFPLVQPKGRLSGWVIWIGWLIFALFPDQFYLGLPLNK